MAPRSFGGNVAQPEESKAFWAAATAASTSLAFMCGTVASFSPEPGSWVSNVALSEPAAALPPTKGCCSSLSRNLPTSGMRSSVAVAMFRLVEWTGLVEFLLAPRAYIDQLRIYHKWKSNAKYAGDGANWLE